MNTVNLEAVLIKKESKKSKMFTEKEDEWLMRAYERLATAVDFN